MDSAELVRAARLEDGLSALQAEIRSRPDDLSLRIFLFQLHCVLGRLDKALNQLQALASLNSDTMLLAQIFRPVIACELLRREIFHGQRTPVVFGEPTEWMGLLIRANQFVAQDQFAAAAQLRAQAFAAAPASPGRINGESFEWVADADSRLGPVLEAIIEGKYYWLPFCRLRRIDTEKPSDLRDLVWLPAQLTLSTGATVPAHLPARYAGTEESKDGGLRLARRTEWQTREGDTCLGLGQRVLATEAGEYPLLECRTLELDQEPPAPA